MSSLIKEFLNGTQRVTAHLYYFMPLEIGQEPLKLESKLLGKEPKKLHHRGILQEFLFQADDRADLDDELKDVFARIMQTSNGLIKIHDRRERITLMQEEAQLAAQKKLADGKSTESNSPAVQVPQIFIPTKEELGNAGMVDINKAFKTMVPYPRLRSFLQFWQETIDGPLHHVQYALGSLADSSYQRQHALN